MELLLSFLVAIGLLVVVNVAWRAAGNRRRARAANLPGGAKASQRQEGVVGRIFTDSSLPGGLKASGINRARVTLVLGEEALLVCSEHGRVLELSDGRPLDARVVGPRRLVLEGQHPSGRANVRVELVLDEAEAWRDAAQALSARVAPSP